MLKNIFKRTSKKSRKGISSKVREKLDKIRDGENFTDVMFPMFGANSVMVELAKCKGLGTSNFDKLSTSISNIMSKINDYYAASNKITEEVDKLKTSLDNFCKHANDKLKKLELITKTLESTIETDLILNEIAPIAHFHISDHIAEFPIVYDAICFYSDYCSSKFNEWNVIINGSRIRHKRICFRYYRGLVPYYDYEYDNRYDAIKKQYRKTFDSLYNKKQDLLKNVEELRDLLVTFKIARHSAKTAFNDIQECCKKYLDNNKLYKKYSYAIKNNLYDIYNDISKYPGLTEWDLQKIWFCLKALTLTDNFSSSVKNGKPKAIDGIAILDNIINIERKRKGEVFSYGFIDRLYDFVEAYK